MDEHKNNNTSQINILLATPCYGGLLSKEYFVGVLDLQEKCFQKGIGLKIFTLGNESLITRARNICTTYFLDSPKIFTHLLFIDADIGFSTENVFRLLEQDKDIVCGIYPKKDLNWQEILRLAKQENINSSHLQAESLMYNVSFPDPNNVNVNNGFVETVDGATGFMLIKRTVFDKMKEKYPELKYNSDHWVNSQKMESDNSYLFFDCMKDPESGRYLSEDYTFCRRWRAIGGQIYSDITMPLVHVGTYAFQGHIAAKFKAKK
jgi:hypothetical protein